MKRLSLLICILVSLFYLSACSKPEKQEQVQVTELNELLKENTNLCASALLAEGNELIGKKKHKLYEQKLYSQSVSSDTADNAPKPIDTNVLSINGVLQYNDRSSHLRLDAYPLNTKNNKSLCMVSYQLDYQLDVPCMVAREEVFKKWIHKGKLGTVTNLYTHKRKPEKVAYLTEIDRNLKCLVGAKTTKIIE